MTEKPTLDSLEKLKLAEERVAQLEEQEEDIHLDKKELEREIDNLKQ